VPIPGTARRLPSAFWRRPDAYLDPTVRAGISTLANGADDLAEDSPACAPISTAAPGRRHADLLDATSSTSDTACSSAPAAVGTLRRSGTRVRRFCPCPRRPYAAAQVVARRPVAPASGRPEAGREERCEQPAAKRCAAKRSTAKSRGQARDDEPREHEPRDRDQGGASARGGREGLSALRDTLRKGVVLTADGVKTTLDDAVKRGRITRKDATELSQSLLAAGRSQADGFRSDLEQLLGRGRDRAAHSGDRVLQEVDRARVAWASARPSPSAATTSSTRRRSSVA
jgi:hypothetical protein